LPLWASSDCCWSDAPAREGGPFAPVIEAATSLTVDLPTFPFRKNRPWMYPGPGAPAATIIPDPGPGASPCIRPGGWIWPGSTTRGVIICAMNEGSGGILTLTAYEGQREILHFWGLRNGGLEVLDAPAGGPPEIVAWGGQPWLEPKVEPKVTARFTFTYRDGSYILARQEWQEDWTYHVSRLVALLAQGEPERAASEFAGPLPGGVAAYIRSHVGNLPGRAGGRWTTRGHRPEPGLGPGRVWLHPQ